MERSEQPLTQRMMYIADHPSYPWLDEYLKQHKQVPFKFGEPKKKVAKTYQPVIHHDIETPSTNTEFDGIVSSGLVKHLASKVKEND